MIVEMYQVDAFASKLFTGNPAAVCLLNEWISDSLMQSIASENNLAETAFVVPREDEFEIRWFTPLVEVDLCGHATLASAHVLMQHRDYERDEVTFHSSHSGKLTVRKDGDLYILNFPSDSWSPIETSTEILGSLNHRPSQCFRGKTDVMAVFETRRQIETIEPDFRLLMQVDARGLIVTAPGEDCDFVSRFFAPQAGIDEDPVTGSAHTTLIPYWGNRLGKSDMLARQISQRGGTLHCKFLDDRVEIGGLAQTYLVGEITVSND